jgi:flagellar L-ring protein precursor FlgH
MENSYQLPVASYQLSVISYCKAKGKRQKAKGKSRGSRLSSAGYWLLATGYFRSTGYWLLATGYFVLLSGCAPQMKVRFNPQPTSEELAQEVARVSQSAVPRSTTGPVSPGSLWPVDDRIFFYGDRKAFRVGDVLTVQVSESAKASNTADTDLSRKTANKAEITALLGLQGALANSELSNLIDVTSDSSHTGAGSTKREGKLTASITAIVKEVLPNGNLVIQGRRAVVVNNEEQYMTLTGVVRQDDIDRDNMVVSSHIADARITFGGMGVIADKQRSGWGTWVFDWLFPF